MFGHRRENAEPQNVEPKNATVCQTTKKCGNNCHAEFSKIDPPKATATRERTAWKTKHRVENKSFVYRNKNMCFKKKSFVSKTNCSFQKQIVRFKNKSFVST